LKTAGVDKSVWRFEGRARVFQSQEAACDAIMADRVVAGDVVVITYEGPRGGPGMQEMLYRLVPQRERARRVVRARHGRALQRRHVGLSIGHASPEAAERGAIALVEEGDKILIDIAARTIELRVDDAALEERRMAMNARADGWHPKRDREVSVA